MAIAHDIFAETNPAYCASLLATFCKAYSTKSGSYPDAILCYSVLPIALSGDLSATFNGTDRRTGLLEWLRRNPAIQIRLAARINGSLDIVTEAIRFGCFANLIAMTPEGRIAPSMLSGVKKHLAGVSEQSALAFKSIDRLGHWLAMAGSSRTTFDLMGLEL